MFTSRYLCEKCKTILEVTAATNDFPETTVGYCGHVLKAA